MNEWQFLAALAVPVIGLTGALLQKERTPGVLRRLRESSAALKDLPIDSRASEALQDLIVTQAEALKEKELRRVNSANLVLAIVLSLLAAAGTYGLSFWTVTTWASPVGWIAVTASIIIGLALVLLVAAGFANIYKEPSAPKATK